MTSRGRSTRSACPRGTRSSIATPACRFACGARPSRRRRREATPRSPRPQRAQFLAHSPRDARARRDARRLHAARERARPDRHDPHRDVRAARAGPRGRRRRGQLHVRARSPRDDRLDRAAARLGRASRASTLPAATLETIGAQLARPADGYASTSSARRARRSSRSCARAATRARPTSSTASSRPCRSRRRARPAAGTCGSTRPTRAPVARHSTLMFASGRCCSTCPIATRGGTRNAQPAPRRRPHGQRRAGHLALDGTITWASGDCDRDARPQRPVRRDHEQGRRARHRHAHARSRMRTSTWSKATDEPADAQLDSFVFATRPRRSCARSSTRTSPGSTTALGQRQREPDLQRVLDRRRHPLLQGATASARTRAGSRTSSITSSATRFTRTRSSPATAQFDGSLSEGVADTLAVAITGDHGMGRGFFFNDPALRDVGTGSTSGGPTTPTASRTTRARSSARRCGIRASRSRPSSARRPATTQFLKVYYAVVQRSPDIPDSFPAALVGDDDNGDLSDGTPNQCEIQAAFAAHGLVDPAATLGLAPPMRDGYTVSLTRSRRRSRTARRRRSRRDADLDAAGRHGRRDRADEHRPDLDRRDPDAARRHGRALSRRRHALGRHDDQLPAEQGRPGLPVLRRPGDEAVVRGLRERRGRLDARAMPTQRTVGSRRADGPRR